ncbi:MAG: hypothetical protein K9H49_04905 [Bacteroidales bacterium]|nr:hypothetical protein [Bacteroidales bacterium]MCF8391234.1 hypothetical protein [Bacteroidales bacterium]
MDTSFIPTPDGLPVSWQWFQVLLLFTFALHIILVNLVLGGSILALFSKNKANDFYVFNGNIPIMVALAINLGVPPLLFLQVIYGHLFYSSSVLMAVYWIIIIPLLILAYYGTYIYVKNNSFSVRWRKISLVISTLFLLYIAFMFVNNSTLAQKPADWLGYFDNSNGTMLHWNEPTLWPRFLHFLFASVAIAALGKALFYKYSNKISPEDKELQIKSNLKIVAFITMVQFIIGTWFWLSMPEVIWKMFMGGQMAATIFMTVGLIGALGIIYSGLKGNLNLTLILGVLQVMIMIIVRQYSRAFYLDGIFRPSDLQNSHQPSSLIVFLIVFLVGLATLYYMIRLSATSKNNQS